MFRSPRLVKLNTGMIALALLAVVALAAAILGKSGTADAATGGIQLSSSKSGSKGKAASKGARFGARILREGMTGPDVKVLKGIVRSKQLLSGALNKTFDRPTTSAVRRFQRSEQINRSGVVNRRTARKMIGSLGTSEASWYGPGLYGNGTACGKVTLRPTTVGIAHKTLPCGTKVLIGYRGKFVIAPVIDRGPYIRGRTWDLTKAASDAIGLTSSGIGQVRHALVSRGR